MSASKFTLAQAEAALLKNYGNVSAAARALGVGHPTLFDRIKRYPRLQKVRELAEEQALDLAEHSLLKAVRAGEGWATCFMLKTKGKKRGYVERQELTNAPDNPFTVSILGPVMGGGEDGAGGKDEDSLLQSEK